MSQTQQLWQELATAALIGSERNQLNLSLADSKLGNTLAQFDSSDREGNLLSNAAVFSLYNRAGSLPDKFKVEESLAPKEDKPRCKPQAAAQLLTMLSGQYREVLPEWLKTLAETNQRVPEELLPNLLELARTQNDLRDLIEPVLGQRGRWLARQNPDWNFADAIADIDDDWQTGNKITRLKVLKQLRAVDPAKALALVESTWAEDKPEERADFLETFAKSLSMADEPFLERALDDKRKEVRTTTASLLSQLPESRLVQRMIERVKPLLKWKYDAKSKKSEIEVTLPEKCDKAMLRDGIEAKPPQYSNKGEKTWWLEQMLQAVPPQFWLDYWTTTPDNLVTVMKNNSEWAKILLNALALATINHKDKVMAEKLLKLVLKEINGQHHQSLVAVLAANQRENLLLELIEAETLLVGSLVDYLVTLGANWDLKLSRAFLQYIHDQIANFPNSNINLSGSSTIEKAAKSISPTLVAEAAQMWPREVKSWQSWSNTAEKFMALLQFRANMLAALGKQ